MYGVYHTVSECIRVYHTVSECITLYQSVSFSNRYKMIDKILSIRQLECIKPDTNAVVESIQR